MVVVIIIVGLVLGGIGFSRETEPQDRSAVSNCGGIILLALVVNNCFILNGCFHLVERFIRCLGLQ